MADAKTKGGEFKKNWGPETQLDYTAQDTRAATVTLSLRGGPRNRSPLLEGNESTRWDRAKLAT